jgi:hypothetical protein
MPGEMTDGELADLWLRYAEENEDKDLKELENPISFAKFLTKSKRIASLQQQIHWLWVAVIVLSIGIVVLSALNIYIMFLLDIRRYGG